MLSNLNPSLTLAYKLSSKNLTGVIEELRAKYSLKFIPAESLAGNEVYPLLRVTKQQLYLEHNNQTLFFHPNMALLRMINLKRGMGDRFLEAVELAPGDTLLDATMGLGSDALIASWAAGEKGKVLALEYSPLLYLLVKEGLQKLGRQKSGNFKNKEKEQAWLELAKASSRLEIGCADHRSMLESLPDSSVDVIYFDPMFRVTVDASCSLKPLKAWSYPQPLEPKTVQQACRAARKRVVLKERRNSGEFARLGFKLLESGRYSSIGFGIIDLTAEKGEKPCSP